MTDYRTLPIVLYKTYIMCSNINSYKAYRRGIWHQLAVYFINNPQDCEVFYLVWVETVKLLWVINNLFIHETVSSFIKKMCTSQINENHII